MDDATLLSELYKEFCKYFGDGSNDPKPFFVTGIRRWDFATHISERTSRHVKQEPRFPSAVIGFVETSHKIKVRWWRRWPDKVDPKTGKLPQGIYTIELHKKTKQLATWNNIGTHPSLRPYEKLPEIINGFMRRLQNRSQKNRRTTE